MLGAGVACRDQYLIDEIPRARLVEMPVFDLALDDFAEAQKRKAYLFEAGRRVASECLHDWGAMHVHGWRPTERASRALASVSADGSVS